MPSSHWQEQIQSNIKSLLIRIFHCFIAGKFEEREDRVPKLEMLNSLGCMSSMNLVLTKQGLLHMELLLLETFQWNLYLPTAAHFIEFYLSIAVHEADLHNGWPIGCLDKTKLFLAKYADYFLEVSLQGKQLAMLSLNEEGKHIRVTQVSKCIHEVHLFDFLLTQSESTLKG